MAERIKVAELYVGDDGIVRAVKSSETAIRGLEKQTKGTADVFTARMFNMRTAAQAFLGTFTLAGGILAFKSFVTSVFEAQENFKAFAASTEKTQKSMFRLVGDVLGLNKALADTSAILDAINAKSEASRGGQDWGVLGKILLGVTNPGRVLLALEGLLHLGAGAAGPVVQGPPAPSGLLTEGPYNPTGEAAAKAFAAQKQAILDSEVSLSEYNLAALEGGKLNRDLYDSAITAASGFQTLDSAIEETNIDMDVLVEPTRWQKFKTAFKDAINEIVPDLTLVTAAVSSAQAAIDGMSNALIRGFEEGGLTFKKVIAGILEAVGQMLIYLGSAAVIKGIFTYNAAETAAGLAAIGIGGAALALASKWGAGSESSALGGGFGASPALAGGGRTYNITNIIDGSSNPEAVARKVVIAIKRATADGAGGGSI